MGATASRDLNNAIATCVNRGDTFESLLEDQDVINSTFFLILALLTVIQFARRCKAFYQDLTPIAQKRFDRTLHQPQAKREDSFLSKLQQVQEEDRMGLIERDVHSPRLLVFPSFEWSAQPLLRARTWYNGNQTRHSKFAHP